MKHFLIILVTSTLIAHTASAEEFAGYANLENNKLNDATFNGPANLKGVSAKSLNVRGPLEFSDLKVEGDTKVAGPVSGSKKGTFGSLKVNGPFEATDVICSEFIVKGPVEVTELTVNGRSDIGGSLEAKKSHFQDLKVKGPTEVNELTVKGETNILGPFEAKKSHFQNINVTADTISLEDVEAKDIVIKGSRSMEQVLQLNGKTVINGNITFKSGKGIVEQGPSVKIQGEVKGGTVNKM